MILFNDLFVFLMIMYQIRISGLEKAIVWGGLKEQYVIKMTYFQNSLGNLLE